MYYYKLVTELGFKFQQECFVVQLPNFGFFIFERDGKTLKKSQVPPELVKTVEDFK